VSGYLHVPAALLPAKVSLVLTEYAAGLVCTWCVPSGKEIWSHFSRSALSQSPYWSVPWFYLGAPGPSCIVSVVTKFHRVSWCFMFRMSVIIRRYFALVTFTRHVLKWYFKIGFGRFFLYSPVLSPHSAAELHSAVHHFPCLYGTSHSTI